MECEFSRFGCAQQLSNADHHLLHLQAHSHNHLQLVVQWAEERLKAAEVAEQRAQDAEERLKKYEVAGRRTPEPGRRTPEPDRRTPDAEKRQSIIEERLKALEVVEKRSQETDERLRKLELAEKRVQEAEERLKNLEAAEKRAQETEERLRKLEAADKTVQERLNGVVEPAEKAQAEALEERVKELEAKLLLLQGHAGRNGVSVKQNGSLPPDSIDVKSKEDAQPKSTSPKASSPTSISQPSKPTFAPPKQEERNSFTKNDLKQSSSSSSFQRNEPPKYAKSDEEVRAVFQKGDVEALKADARPLLSATPPPASTPPPYISRASPFDTRQRSTTWSSGTPTPKKKDELVFFVPNDIQAENAIVWEYDSTSDEWCRGIVSIRIAKQSFAEGSLRSAHMLEIQGNPNAADDQPIEKLAANGKNIRSDALPTIGGDKYVAKIAKGRVPIDRYFEDVKMQAVCAELAKKFNMAGTPKKVSFLNAWVLEIPRATGTVWCGLEQFLAGKFDKHNNNSGAVINDDAGKARNTPQAFSHFTWVKSSNKLIVVDMQGVDDEYTDPQIHTVNGVGYGIGNLGKNGIDRFLKSHQCNAVCNFLELPKVNASDNSKIATQKIVKGTQLVPNVEDQLSRNQTFPVLEIPEDFNSGEFQCIQSLSGHGDRVVSLCVTPTKLFSGSTDGSLRVWGLPDLNFEKELNVHRKSVEAICASDNFLFTASADHSIKVWEVPSYAMNIALRDHVGEVNAIALTDKSLNYLVSASFDKKIKVWSLKTFRCVNTLSGHSKCVRTLAISGTILFSGSNDGSIFMWSLKTMQCLFGLDAHDGWVKSIALKDKTLFTGSFDNNIKEWNITNFQYGEKIVEYKEHVNALCLTDRYLISGSDDKTATVWDMATRQCVAILKGHRLGIQAVVTDGKQIYTASDDCSVKVWKWVQA